MLTVWQHRLWLFTFCSRNLETVAILEMAHRMDWGFNWTVIYSLNSHLHTWYICIYLHIWKSSSFFETNKGVFTKIREYIPLSWIPRVTKICTFISKIWLITWKYIYWLLCLVSSGQSSTLHVAFEMEVELIFSWRFCVGHICVSVIWVRTGKLFKGALYIYANIKSILFWKGEFLYVEAQNTLHSISCIFYVWTLSKEILMERTGITEGKSVPATEWQLWGLGEWWQIPHCMWILETVMSTIQ